MLKFVYIIKENNIFRRDNIMNRINIEDARKNDLLKEMFLEQNIKLVYSVAHKINVYLDFDEKVSAGQLGYLKAFNTFDSNLNYNFSTYATRLITNEILMENRKAIYKRSQRVQSLEKVIAEDGNDQLLLKDIVAIKENEYNNFDYQAVVMAYNKFIEIYSKKEPRLVQIFNMYIFEKKTTIDIAKTMDITQPWASKLVKKAIMSLQEIAIEMDIIDGYNNYSKKNNPGVVKERKDKENPTKCRALYVILNYPELSSNEIGKIVNWDPMKVGKLKRSYINGTFKLSPDSSIKEQVEKYLVNKKIYA
jgi:RNA polymerase sporulation-specific sigma factor